jgi:hypothetical protein
MKLKTERACVFDTGRRIWILKTVRLNTTPRGSHFRANGKYAQQPKRPTFFGALKSRIKQALFIRRAIATQKKPEI